MGIGCGQSVPQNAVLAFGEEVAAKQLANDLSLGVFDVQRDVAVSRQGKRDRLEPEQRPARPGLVGDAPRGGPLVAAIRFFAAVAEAAGTESTSVDVATVGELRTHLAERHGPEFSRILSRCSVLVNGTRAADDQVPLAGTDTVDVLPPFAGG